jgi:hypothetical protein
MYDLSFFQFRTHVEMAMIGEALPWPQGYSSSASRFLSAVFLIPAEGSRSNDGSAEEGLTVIGDLPSDISASTLRPFLAESYREQKGSGMEFSWGSRRGRRGGGGRGGGGGGGRQGFGRASLVLTDGAGQPIYVEAAELAPPPPRGAAAAAGPRDGSGGGGGGGGSGSAGDTGGGGGASLAVCSAFPAFELASHLLHMLLHHLHLVEEAAAARGADSSGGAGVGKHNGSSSSLEVAQQLLAHMMHCAVFAVPPPMPGQRLSVNISVSSVVNDNNNHHHQQQQQQLTGGPFLQAARGIGSGGCTGPNKSVSSASGGGGGGSGGGPSFSWGVGDLAPLDRACDDMVLSCLPPLTLVGAWEALLFERPVVVLSSSAALLTPAVCF